MGQRFAWVIVATTSLVLPFVVTPAGTDLFRLGKHVVLLASGMTLATIAICSLLLGTPLNKDAHWPRHLPLLILSTLGWCALDTIVSTNRELSIYSMLTLGAAAMFFCATYLCARTQSLSLVLGIVFVPPLINSFTAVMQRVGAWTVFAVDVVNGRGHTTAFIGNANDVGMYLVAPSLAAAALGLTSRRHRIAAFAVTAILLAGMAASETVGALAAAFAGLMVLLFSIHPRTATIAALLAVLTTTAYLRLSPVRWEATRAKLVSGDIDRMLSGRLPAFLAAWNMFKHHPVFGVGIGCFGYQYFDEKIAVEFEHPWLMDRHAENFAEVHNEHLQVLAEGGLPAYCLFLASLVLLARVKWTTGAETADLRGAFARRLALPLAVAIAVLTLSSFPFRLAAPAQSILFLCAAVFAWSDDGSN